MVASGDAICQASLALDKGDPKLTKGRGPCYYDAHMQLIEEGRAMQPQQKTETWRELLETILSNPAERERIASEMGLRSITLTR